MANPETTLGSSCTMAQTKFPKNCSGAVKLIAKQMGYDLPDLLANGLIDYFAANWKEVSEADAQAAADNQQLVVAGKKAASDHGHVVVVMPGGMASSGGYSATVKTKKGPKTITMPNKGNYPRSCSTALGPWPGAVSNGTKSVFDAWGSASNYVGVKYWIAPPLKP